MNIKVRVKNPYFWVGLIGVVIAAIGVEVESLSSWGALAETLLGFIRNPFAIGSAVMAILGVLVDPTTGGIKDSAQAMTYRAPKRD